MASHLQRFMVIIVSVDSTTPLKSQDTKYFRGDETVNVEAITESLPSCNGFDCIGFSEMTLDGGGYKTRLVINTDCCCIRAAPNKTHLLAFYGGY